MCGRYRPSRNVFKRQWRNGLHSKSDGAKACSIEEIDQVRIQVVQTRFTFECDRQFLANDGLGNRDTSLLFFSEQRIAKDNLRLAILRAEPFKLGHHILGRAGAVGCRCPMWAVSTELRTAAAGQYRQGRPRRE